MDALVGVLGDERDERATGPILLEFVMDGETPPDRAPAIGTKDANLAVPASHRTTHPAAEDRRVGRRRVRLDVSARSHACRRAEATRAAGLKPRVPPG
ncbi:hypothetical protein [Streptomyces sp. NPDC001292]|uniref:hypothetical protein n=1 Tax=Streptomyces sp. NPDC001292 TaxID=3364558 RepID=UPI0036CC1A18